MWLGRRADDQLAHIQEPVAPMWRGELLSHAPADPAFRE